LTIERLVSEMT